jgi:hypothetical protein
MKTKTNQSILKARLLTAGVIVLFAVSLAALSASLTGTNAPRVENASATAVFPIGENEEALAAEKAAAEKAIAAAVGDQQTRQEPAPARKAAPSYRPQSPLGALTGVLNIPGDYPDLAAAIADLNASGVGAGGVTLNVIAGNPQSAPAGGYVVGGAGSLVLTTTSAADQVLIEGNGNTITAPTPQASGNLNDAIFKLIGADYITINAFVMQENAANTTTTAGTNNMTEWGVALLYVTATDGGQNNTISNNAITLNRTYQNTFGIYSNSTHTATAVTTSATATGAAGGNHNLRVYGNSIGNVNNGIVVVGPTGAADANTGIDIGGAGGAQANAITNFGTTGTFSAYANVSGTVNGILVRNSIGFNVSFNTVTSSVGGTTAGTLNGIQIPAASATPTTTFTNTINSNIISLQSAAATGAMNGISYPSGSASTTSTLNVNGNNFNTFGHTVAASGTITFITVTSTNRATSISNNTFTNISVNTTGSVTFISNSMTAPANGTKDINNNSIVTSFTKTGAGGTITLFTDNGSDPATVVANNNNNNFSNITVTGATSIAGWSQTNGGAPAKNIMGNTFSNWTGGISSITALSSNFGGNNVLVSNNTISNITYSPTATLTTLTGISIGASNNGASQTYSNNTVSGLTSNGTGGQVIGILGGSTLITTLNINNNTVSGITSASTTGVVVAGIFNQNTGPTVNIFKNKVYDVMCSPGAVLGINSTAAAATNTINIYNNLVGRLYAPTSAFFQAARGLLLQSAVAATFNVSFNSVYLDGTTPTQTYCVYIGGATANVPNVNPRDNIFFNNVTSSNGPTLPQTVYFRLGTTTATNLASTANKNLLYAGTPAADHLIYVDGAVNLLTNPQQTLGDYQAFVAPRENFSITGDPLFLNTTIGANANFLHISNASPAFQTGTPIAGITDDYDGDLRHPCTPDIGGDEVMSYAGPAVANVTIMKTADSSTVIFGNQVGFVVKLTNTTANPALGLTVSDNLPAAPGVNWTIDAGATDSGWSVVGAPPNQSLQYSPTTLAGNTMTQAHVVSATTVATCGSTLNNTASFSITNGCPGADSGQASASIVVIGGGGPTTALSQGWESGLGSWTTVNNTTGGTPANTAWTIRPNPYTSPNATPVTFNSFGGSNFILSNADFGGSGTLVFTILQSPSFSTVNYTTLNLSYRHYYRFLSATEAFVEVSTDGGANWTTLKSYTSTQGTPTAFVADSVNMDAYVGQSDVSVRFRYQDGWSWYWAIDDIVVSGNQTVQPCPAPLMATGAVSRKNHNGVDHDINLPLSGNSGIECRGPSTTANPANPINPYQIIFSFANDVTVDGSTTPPPSAATLALEPGGTGTVSGITVDQTGPGSTVTVDLAGVSDVQSITLTLDNVSDGSNAGDIEVNMSVLIGDAQGIGNYSVGAGDISFVKGEASPGTVDSTNFRADLTVNGSINAGDISAVKGKSGNGLLPQGKCYTTLTCTGTYVRTDCTDCLVGLGAGSWKRDSDGSCFTTCP